LIFNFKLKLIINNAKEKHIEINTLEKEVFCNFLTKFLKEVTSNVLRKTDVRNIKLNFDFQEKNKKWCFSVLNDVKVI
jgi:hypothetical protein